MRVPLLLVRQASLFVAYTAVPMAAKIAAAAGGLGLWAKKYGLLVAKAVIGLLYGSEPHAELAPVTY